MPRLAHLLLFAGVCLFVLAVHNAHFADRSYRQDEAWRAHLAVERDLRGTIDWTIGNLHPPLWQVTLDGWVAAFGHTEAITRLLSALFTALALAFTYRLAADLFGHPVALRAVFLLGSLAFFQYYMHETRPYAALTASTTAMHLLFVRWLRRPNLARALGFVAAGIVAIYIHFYGLFFVAALAVYCLLFVQRERWLRAAGLFAAVGLAFLGWFPSFVHSFVVTRPGGIDYALEPTAGTLWDNLVYLFNQMTIRPLLIGQIVLLLALLMPVWVRGRVPFRFGRGWALLHVLAVPLILLVMAFVANQFVSSLTPRNLIILLPPLAIFAALGLVALPRRAQAVLLLFITLTFVQNFRAYIANGPYREMSAFMAAAYQPGEPVVIDSAFVWQQVPITYYVRERLPVRVPEADLYHLMNITNRAALNNLPRPPEHLASADTPAARADFSAFLADAEQVWYLAVEDGSTFGGAFVDILNTHYLAAETATWGLPRYPQHQATRYRRIPPELTAPFVFGDSIRLRHWHLRASTESQPCAALPVDSWWQADRVPTENYSMTLVLAGPDGVGITRSDGSPSPVLMGQWHPGQLYLDERTLTIPCDTPPGSYNLLAGLYNFDSGVPLGDLVYLTTVTLP